MTAPAFDPLTHWVRTLQDANIPLVQLQDPSPVRGPGLLVVTDEQRIDLWAAANREHARLTRGTWYEKWWGRLAIAAGLLSSVSGTAAAVVVLIRG